MNCLSSVPGHAEAAREYLHSTLSLCGILQGDLDLGLEKLAGFTWVAKAKGERAAGSQLHLSTLECLWACHASHQALDSGSVSRTY